MKLKNRQQLLTFAAVALVAFFAADKLLFTPLSAAWSNRSKRIADLRKKVDDGKALAKRESSLRGRWDTMWKNTLPNNESAAEQQVLQALDRWARDSSLTITSFGQQWKRDNDDYMTLLCRVEASGSLERIRRFLYDLEKDPMALKLENLEISSRDTEGQQLSVGLQISGLVLAAPQKP
jgi:Tfp pilus assembly protein PilO